MVIATALSFVLVARCVSEFRVIEMKEQNFVAVRNVTFLALASPVNSHHYGEVLFHIDPLYSSEVQSTLTTCLTSCSKLPVRPLNTTSTHHISGCKTTRYNSNCFVEFNESNDEDYTTLYVMKGSNFTIEVDFGYRYNNTASLYLFYNTDTCEAILDIPNNSYIGRDGKAGPIKFDKSNSSFSLTMKNDSFICAYWSKVSADFDYNITRHFQLYDFGLLSTNTCSTSSFTRAPVEAVSVPLPGSAQSQCVIADLGMYAADYGPTTNLTIEPVELSCSNRIRRCIFSPGENIVLLTWMFVVVLLLVVDLVVVFLVYYCCTYRYRHYQQLS